MSVKIKLIFGPRGYGPEPLTPGKLRDAADVLEFACGCGWYESLWDLGFRVEQIVWGAAWSIWPQDSPGGHHIDEHRGKVIAEILRIKAEELENGKDSNE